MSDQGGNPGTGQVGTGSRLSDLHPLGYGLSFLPGSLGVTLHFEVVSLTDLKQLAFALSSWVSAADTPL